jgi:hypothetical protein
VFAVMKVKWVVPAVAGAFLFFSLNPVLLAVSTRRIRDVRNRDVLNSDDLRIIDHFIAEAVKEMVRTKDFSSVAAVRNAISEHASSNKPSAPQYEAQFFESAHKYISQALQKAQENDDFLVEVNILILIDRLLATGPEDLRLADVSLAMVQDDSEVVLATGPEDLRLADVALAMVQDDSAVVRYLAVGAVTNPAIARKLDPKLAARIASQLNGIVQNSSPETMGMMARFAAEMRTAEGKKLLLQVADRRISQYVRWAVKYEPLDDMILKSLCKRISSAGTDSSSFAQRFVHLYSYAIQRYVKDMQSSVFASNISRELAASALLEVEKVCISQLTGKPHSAIKSSIERGNQRGLLQAHDSLLRQELPRMFPGVQPPLPLPDPPKPKASE